MRARTIDIYDQDGYYYTSITITFSTIDEYFSKVNQIMSRYPSNWYFED